MTSLQILIAIGTVLLAVSVSIGTWKAQEWLDNKDQESKSDNLKPR
jgi:hypothetical protein